MQENYIQYIREFLIFLRGKLVENSADQTIQIAIVAI